MTTTSYNPVSWNGEPITNAKLNQMSNNIQYIFDRQPKIRYSVAGITKDTGLKIIVGKTAYAAPDNNFVYLPVYFGSYFSAGCKPIVVAQCESPNNGHRNKITTWGLNQNEIDHTGFYAVVSTEVTSKIPGGWVHWQAVGY